MATGFTLAHILSFTSGIHLFIQSQATKAVLFAHGFFQPRHSTPRGQPNLVDKLSLVDNIYLTLVPGAS